MCPRHYGAFSGPTHPGLANILTQPAHARDVTQERNPERNPVSVHLFSVIRCQFIFSSVIRCQFIFSGKNDELRPDFNWHRISRPRISRP